MVIGNLLIDKKKTVCTSESCTGGNIAHMITTVPGSSEYYKGSVIAYENKIKVQLLKVNKKLIDTEGAVSEDVVKEMAEN